ncbi:S8 family serine peptidase, partial [Halobium palmae]
DSGIDVRNPFVAGAVRTRHDYTGGGEWDATGHGTLIALQFVDLDRNTRRHALGATPTRLVDMKVADAVGFSEGNLICALNDALVEGVDLVNLSLGLRTHGEREPCPLCTAVNRLAEFGVFVCVAAGNRPADAPQYTAYCPCIAEGSICTGAVEPDGTLAPFTELGEVYTDGRIGVYDVSDFWEIEFSPGISGSFVPRDAVEYVRRLARDAAEPHVLLIELYPGETLAFTPEGFLEYVEESLSAMERPDYGLLPNPGKITPVPVA